MRRAFAPKVGGARSCWEALRGSAVGPVVLFSSIASLMGSPGQASYAAANAVLDGMAAAWHAAGSSAVSVQWGAWAGGGMAVQDAGTLRRLERSGMGAISATEGMAALEGLLRAQGGAALGGLSQVAVAPVDWGVFVRRSGGRIGWLTAADAEALPSSAEEAQLPSSQGTRRAGVSASSAPVLQLGGVSGIVVSSVKSVLGSDFEDSPDARQMPLLSMGLDSLGAVELRHALETEFGIRVPATVLFDYPTIDELSSYLHAGMVTEHGAASASQPYDPPGHQALLKSPDAVIQPDGNAWVPSQRPVIGVSSVVTRLPQNPMELEESWASHDFSSVLPMQRWDVEATLRDRQSTAVRHGVFVDHDISLFDSNAFEFSDTEIVLMDPQQRIVLECAAEQVISSKDSVTANCGVFVGIWQADYQDLTGLLSSTSYHATGSSVSVAAGRVSYTLALKGPAMSVDTACSASLVAAHLGRASIMGSECQSAMASGVSLILTPGKYVGLDAASMLSVSGRCKALDSAADGYARGEAVVSMLLQPASEEKSLALLAGSAVNQDGRSSALTAPHGPSQQAAVCMALDGDRVKFDNLEAIQMHGTGTSLGDPIEVGALTAVLDEFRGRENPDAVALQACKSMFAHSEAAAGLMGVLSAARMHASSRVLGIQNLRDLNPHVQEHIRLPMAGEATPSMPAVTGIRQDRSSPVSGPGRYNCTSSFAYQGTNCTLATTTPHGASLALPLRQTICTWRRGRFWPIPARNHGLLTGVSIAAGQEVILHGPVQLPASWKFWDHAVQGQAIMPGACYFELASSTMSQLACSHGIEDPSYSQVLLHTRIPQPLLLGDSDRSNETSLRAVVSLDKGTLRVSSRDGKGSSSLHLAGYTGTLASRPVDRNGRDNNNSRTGGLLPKRPQLLLADNNHSQQGAVVYGQTVPGLEVSNQAMSNSAATAHPAIADACLQLGHQLGGNESGDSISATYVPAGVEAIVLGGANPDSALQTFAKFQPRSSPACLVLDHWMIGRQGVQAGALAGFEAKPIQVSAPRAPSRRQETDYKLDESILHVEWAACEPEYAPGSLGNAHSSGPSLPAGHLSMAGKQGGVPDTCLAVQAVIQQSLSSEIGDMRLQCATGLALGAYAAQPDIAGLGLGKTPQHGALLGMAKTAAQESGRESAVIAHQGRSYGPGQSASSKSGALTVSVPRADNAQEQVSTCFTGAQFAGLLVRNAMDRPLPPHHLIPGKRGTFGCLGPEAVLVDSLGPGEVALQVQAVGINFRDVLNVLGMYPGDPGHPGADVSGTVVAVGAGVSRLRVGQRVFGLAPGCLGSHVICTEETLAPLPHGISLDQAATVPTVFVTVDMALRAAGAERGQAMLVHAAAGGVGLAAVQQGQALGLTVVATAGSGAKRSMLRSLGVEAVHNSRSTDFVEGLALQHPAGVDIVLNSLTSAGMVAASIATIRAGGCMVELSKRDIWSHAQLMQSRADACYQLLAMDFLPGNLLQTSLGRVADGLARAKIRPLPGVMHSMRHVQAALRQMSQVCSAFPPPSPLLHRPFH